MSKRKDREQIERRKRFDPGYKGYRGPTVRPEPKPELKIVMCTVCGRKRNVPPDTKEEGFVCAACQATAQK